MQTQVPLHWLPKSKLFKMSLQSSQPAHTAVAIRNYWWTVVRTLNPESPGLVPSLWPLWPANNWHVIYLSSHFVKWILMILALPSLSASNSITHGKCWHNCKGLFKCMALCYFVRILKSPFSTDIIWLKMDGKLLMVEIRPIISWDHLFPELIFCLMEKPLPSSPYSLFHIYFIWLVHPLFVGERRQSRTAQSPWFPGVLRSYRMWGEAPRGWGRCGLKKGGTLAELTPIALAYVSSNETITRLPFHSIILSFSFC